MNQLIPGQNCQISCDPISFKLTASKPADYSAFVLDGTCKVGRDEDFIFHGLKTNPENTISLNINDKEATFCLDLKTISENTNKIVFAVTPNSGTIQTLGKIEFELEQKAGEKIEGSIDTTNRPEKALIIREIYRYKGNWKYRFVAQGFNGGLKPLAEHFGVEIENESATANTNAPTDLEELVSPAPAQQKKVNLSKITLTKEKPKVSLDKREAGIKEYKINLNWNRSSKNKVGFFDFIIGNTPTGIDLDLAAYYKLKNGEDGIIQALDKDFGDLEYPPYIQLLGDDRTGENEDGEWIIVNGKHIDEIDEILILSFIYEGVAALEETDGKVTLYIGDYPPVETFLDEGENDLGLCAIARIKNSGNKLSIERLNEYFPGHSEMDEAYGWGFSWTEGYK